MGTIIKIKNCNCISDANIYMEENSLNIKYGFNGTGIISELSKNKLI